MKQPISKKPNKQRRFAKNLDLHQQQKRLSGHLSKSLREQFHTRSLPLRKGDTVVVTRGKWKKKTGKIIGILYRIQKVTIEKLTRKKSDGKEIAVKIPASKIMVTELDTKDSKRFQNKPEKAKKQAGEKKELAKEKPFSEKKQKAAGKQKVKA